MGELLKKSVANFKSADILISKHSLYASSIHCSYYSSIQILLHLMKNELKDEWQTYEDQISANKLNNPNYKAPDLHNLYISFVKIQLLKKDFTIAQNFSTSIGKLKNFRVDADYLDKEITFKIANDSYKLSKDINEDLIKYYKL